VVVAPNGDNDHVIKELGLTRIDVALTESNYRDVLTPLLSGTGMPPFLIRYVLGRDHEACT
jgi:hypothetical protein